MAKLKLFLDTNVIIDLLADRKPFSNSAYAIFKAANSKWKLFTSSNSILTSYYILAKQIGNKNANKAISMIIKRLEIKDTSNNEMLIALNSKTEDLEDAYQIECAKTIKDIDHIITRDKTGFKFSHINILHPDELISLYL